MTNRQLLFASITALLGVMAVQSTSAQSTRPEYLWYETENMRGISENARHEPIANPSWLDLPAARAPGWGINGPGVSAEWSQGGESEWNSVAASADEARGRIWQDIEVPRAGEYKVWVRYGDWINKSEDFTVRIEQAGREVARHEFGGNEIVDSHDETGMYWGWVFVWDSAQATLAKGSATISVEIEKPAPARRLIDCVLLTNDLSFVPDGRRKPDFVANRYLNDWAKTRTHFQSLVESTPRTDLPSSWQRPKVSGRDFMMPWNIAKEFWSLYDKPASERPLYPFNAEPIDEFVKTYSGKIDVPIFKSKFVVPVIYINDLAELLKEGSGFRRYLADTHAPFAVLINYGAPKFGPGEGESVARLLKGELRDQFLGWISGESVGYVWDEAPRYLQISPDMTRAQLLEAHREFYADALARKWTAMFHAPTGSMWDKMIPAQSTSSTSFAHPLEEWGVRFLGVETSSVEPMTAMRIAFTRGAARQYGGEFLYYHAPNFGDTATTFTKVQNFAGPDSFFHTRYGATMGPSLTWYRKSYYLYYMSGASAIYLEQGFDQFFKPGPGEHPFQLNPLGRITDEFMRFAEQHPDRGTPYTPIAFLLDPAHGWEMTDFPQWPFGVSQISHSDRALRELFGAAYYPGLVREGEPATGDRQAFVPGIFGDVFDVLVASNVQSPTSSVQRPLNMGATNAGSAGGAGVPPVSNHAQDARATPIDAIDSYRAVIVGGRIDWTLKWIDKLTQYVRNGGVVVLNSAQVRGVPSELLGVRMTDSSAEADGANCLSLNEPKQNLSGQMFRYDKIEAKQASVLMKAPNGDPLVTVNRVGRGKVVFVALRDLLGEDLRLTPFVAHLLVHVAADATPVQVAGDVEYLINRNATGWVVTLFNNNGVLKPQQGLAQVDRNAIVTTTITGQGVAAASEWTSNQTLAVKQSGTAGKITLNLPPGGIAIVELRARP